VRDVYIISCANKIKTAQLDGWRTVAKQPACITMYTTDTKPNSAGPRKFIEI